VLWDARTGKVLRAPVEHAGTVEGVAASADDKLLATAGSEGRVRLWDVRADKELSSLELGASAWSVALDPDGRYLAAGDSNGVVKVWEVSRLLRPKGGRKERRLRRGPTSLGPAVSLFLVRDA
jgi:WD40 repeat protein